MNDDDTRGWRVRKEEKNSCESEGVGRQTTRIDSEGSVGQGLRLIYDIGDIAFHGDAGRWERMDDFFF